MIAIAPLNAAISAHRAAYDAYQVAPQGEAAEVACCEMQDALDALVIAACAFPILSCSLPQGADELLAHLRWWLAEEAVYADYYQPAYAVLSGRAADLARLLASPAPDAGDQLAGPAVPGAAQVDAAWYGLAPTTRDRIGAIAIDMVFQAFVSGDACAPNDRAVRGWSKRARAIRDAAMDASCQRLTEIHHVVEDALPNLFGPQGENPEWAVRMGAKR